MADDKIFPSKKEQLPHGVGTSASLVEEARAESRPAWWPEKGPLPPNLEHVLGIRRSSAAGT